MGVDLGDLAPKRAVGLEELRGKAVAIDAYNTLYQFISIIRQPDGTPLKDAQGRVTSHLSGLLYRTANLAEAGVKPVYVFDGAPPDLKADTLEERRERKRKAERERKEALDRGDTKTAAVKAQQTSRLTGDMAHGARELLDALGIPWVDAPSEGEAQAAHMARKGDVWAASSQDYDALLVGAPRLVRNLAVTGRRKLPGRNQYVNVEPELTVLDEMLDGLRVTREQLIAIGLLVGTDYNKGIKGIGPKRGLKLVQEEGSLDAALAALDEDIPQKDAILDLFLHPRVTDDYQLEWRPPDGERVKALLVGEHGFSESRVDATLPRYEKLQDQLKQRSLDAFF